MTSFSTNEQVCIERQIPELKSDASFTNKNIDKYDIKDTCEWISENKFQVVCLQFPDEILFDSSNVAEKIKSRTQCEVFILGDTSYGSCCVDEVAAQHVKADCMVHYGHACFSPSALPIKHIALKQHLDVEQVVQSIAGAFENKDQKIALFYDFSYEHLSDIILVEVLKRFPKMFSAKKRRVSTSTLASVIQLTNGVDVRNVDALDDYHCIYIGHKPQTMFNLELTVAANSWNFFDTKSLKLLPSNRTTWFKRRRYLVELCKDAKNIGILICTLSISQFLDVIDRLKKIIKNFGRKSYIVSVGKPNIAKLANMSEIDIFVLVGCPENELYSSNEFYKPIIYPIELESALLNKDLSLGSYQTNFHKILNGEDDFINHAGNFTDVSLITGHVRNFEPKESDNKLLLSDVKDLQEVEMALEQMDIGSGMKKRTWRGLEQNLGETEVQKAGTGRSGTSLGYDHENNN